VVASSRRSLYDNNPDAIPPVYYTLTITPETASTVPELKMPQRLETIRSEKS